MVSIYFGMKAGGTSTHTEQGPLRIKNWLLNYTVTSPHNIKAVNVENTDLIEIAFVMSILQICNQ